jgi:hypothetical protein
VLADCRAHTLTATEAYGIWVACPKVSAPATPDVPALRPDPGNAPRRGMNGHCHQLRRTESPNPTRRVLCQRIVLEGRRLDLGTDTPPTRNLETRHEDVEPTNDTTTTHPAPACAPLLLRVTHGL